MLFQCIVYWHVPCIVNKAMNYIANVFYTVVLSVNSFFSDSYSVIQQLYRN